MLITQIKSPYLPVLWIAFLAMLLLALAVPSTIARFIELPTTKDSQRLEAGQLLPETTRLAFLHTKQTLAQWFPTSVTFNDLALEAFLRAEKTPAEAKTLLMQAELWERQALRLSPADPYGWFRLSQILYKRDGALSLRSARAWGQSMRVGRYEPAMMLDRLQVGMAHEPYLTPEDRAYFPVLIRGSAIFDADALARLALTGAFTSTVETVLSGNEKALAHFRKRIQIETAP